MKSIAANIENHHNDLDPEIPKHRAPHQNEAALLGSKKEPVEESAITTIIATPVNKGVQPGKCKTKRSAARKKTGAKLQIGRISQAPPQELIKLKDAAAMLAISTLSVRRLIDRGYFTPIRVLRHHLLRLDEIHVFIEQSSNSSVSPKGTAHTTRTASKTKTSSPQL